MSSLSALTHTQYVLINRLAVPLGGFVLLIIIARHSDRLLGQYALVMTFYYVMQMVPLLGLTSFVMREVAREPRDAGRFFVTIGALSMIGCALVDLACYAFLNFTAYDIAVRHAIAVVAMLIFPGILAFIAEIIFMSINCAKPVALVAVAENLLRVAASAFVLLAGYGVVELVLILCLTRLGALLSYIVIMKRREIVQSFGLPSRALLRRTLKILPVFLWGSIVFTVLSRLDFLVLSLLEQVEVLGHYAIGYRLFEVFVIILTGLVMAMFPWVSRNFVGARRHYLVALRAIITAFAGGLILLAAIGTLFAEYYVQLLFPAQYPAAVTLSRLFAAALLFAGLDFVASGILHASDQQAPDVRAMTLGGALLSALLLALVPPYGIYGAFAAKVASTAVQCGLKLIAIRRTLGPINSPTERAHLLGLTTLVGVPTALALQASLPGKVFLSFGLIVLVPVYLVASGVFQPLRLLRFYRRPQRPEDVESVPNLIDMLVADDRRRARGSRSGGLGHGAGIARHHRAAVLLYRVARFLHLRDCGRLSRFVTAVNAALNGFAISATIKAGPGLVIAGDGPFQVHADLGTNVTLGSFRAYGQES